MRWTRINIFLVFVFVAGCEKLPTLDWVNPLDLEVAAADSVETPALVFFPDTVSTETGASVSFEIFVMEVDSLSASHIQVTYDTTMLALVSAESGEFFDSAAVAPMYFYEDDSASGVLDIYTVGLGIDSLATVFGTGSLAAVEFTVRTSGDSRLEFTQASELVDRDDNLIEINTLFYGAIHAE